MDQTKIGQLICEKRKAKGLTQRQLAEQLSVSEQAVSKWERGMGCPDISLLPLVAGALDIPVEQLLKGEIRENQSDSGNMKRLRFYVCKECGNVITSTSEMEAVCCGKKLIKEEPKKAADDHTIQVELIDGDYYVSMEQHPMTKDHYISFFAYVTCNQVKLTKLYPEQSAITNYRKCGHGYLYAYCKQHGLQYRLI